MTLASQPGPKTSPLEKLPTTTKKPTGLKKNSPGSVCFIAMKRGRFFTPIQRMPEVWICWLAPITTSISRPRGVMKRKSWTGCGITIGMRTRHRPVAVMGGRHSGIEAQVQAGHSPHEHHKSPVGASLLAMTD